MAVSVEPFHFGETGGCTPVPLERLPRKREDAGPLDKIVNAEGRGETGRSPGRQHMVGSRRVVAQRLRRMAIDQEMALRGVTRNDIRRIVEGIVAPILERLAPAAKKVAS